MGLGLGAALTPPLIASLMGSMGWQAALLWSSLPALVLIVGWGWYGRNSPREHAAVTARELQEIEQVPAARASAGHEPQGPPPAAQVDSAIGVKRVLRLMGDRNVLLLAISYLCMNYTFYLLSNWVFLYLVQERNFSLLESGWLATAPPLAAAAGAGLGGVATSLCCRRFGDRWGYRLVPLVALPLAALC